MTRFLLSTIMIMAQATVFADGGTVQFRKDAGDFVITVFTAPAPLSVGPVDISLLLQNRNSLDPLLDAEILLTLREEVSGIAFEARATRENARNKLLYAVPVILAKAGKWRIVIRVMNNGKATDVTGILAVAPAPDKSTSYAGYFAFPPVMVLLFGIRETLIRRRKSKG